MSDLIGENMSSKMWFQWQNPVLFLVYELALLIILKLNLKSYLETERYKSTIFSSMILKFNSWKYELKSEVSVKWKNTIKKHE